MKGVSSRLLTILNFKVVRMYAYKIKSRELLQTAGKGTEITIHEIDRGYL